MNADTFIAINNDKQGVPVTIYWAEKIDGSIVVPFFLRGLAQLIEQGFSGSRLFGTNQSKAVYAVIHSDNLVVQAGCRAYGAKPALLDEAARKKNLPFIRMEKKVPLLYRE